MCRMIYTRKLFLGAVALGSVDWLGLDSWLWDGRPARVLSPRRREARAAELSWISFGKTRRSAGGWSTQRGFCARRRQSRWPSRFELTWSTPRLGCRIDGLGATANVRGTRPKMCLGSWRSSCDRFSRFRTPQLSCGRPPRTAVSSALLACLLEEYAACCLPPEV